MALFGLLTSWLILPSLRPVYSKMSFVHKLMFLFVHVFDRTLKWYNTPVIIGLLYLELRRTLHQKYNLIAVGNAKGSMYSQTVEPLRYGPDERKNGQRQRKDLDYTQDPEGIFFGRNVEPEPEKTQLLDPHPTLVASKLLNRKSLKENGTQFNMLAVSWINFMIHDWIDHLEDLNQELEIIAPSSVAAQCPLKSFKGYPTKVVPAGHGTFNHINRRTAWWDASVIYGSTDAARRRLRSFKDGKLKIRADGWLLEDENSIPISGDVRNLWLGVETFQCLFIAEHNAVCDAIKKAYPKFNDEEIFQRAMVTTAAVLAKIHTIDWTPQLLKNNIGLAALRANWYGLLGKWFKDTVGKTSISLLSGLVGMSKPVDHGVPYSLTEEFTSVYRLHPLLPEKLGIKNIKAPATRLHTPPTVEEIAMPKLIGPNGQYQTSRLTLKTVLTSLGHQSSGSLTAFNYPNWMRDVTAQDVDGTDRTNKVDLASLEIYRDRERSVARYNQFRRSMLRPPITKWEDLTDDKETIAIIREVYGENIERLDLLVGLMAEKKIKGFAISETAFFIFVIMASRRLEADKFFTSEFKDEFYSKVGFKWVNTTEGLKDVIRRHHPELVGDWMTASSAFSVWNQPPDSFNAIPIYGRWSTSNPST